MSDWNWAAIEAIAAAFAIPAAIGAAWYTRWGTNRAAQRAAHDRKLIIARGTRASLEVLAGGMSRNPTQTIVASRSVLDAILPEISVLGINFVRRFQFMRSLLEELPDSQDPVASAREIVEHATELIGWCERVDPEPLRPI